MFRAGSLDGSPGLSTLVASLVVALVVVTTAARAAAGEPTDQLRSQLERVLKTVQDSEGSKGDRGSQRRAVRKIVDEIFDFDETARRVLARHWSQRTPAERQDFVALFSDVFERAYVSKLGLYQGERVTYLGDKIEGRQALVSTGFQTRQGSQVQVDYRMHRGAGDRFVVYDVIIEGVSLIDNYRAQFNSVIQRSSYGELVRKLRTIQAQRESEDGRGPGRP